MSLKITKSDIDSSSTLTLLDFNINTSGFSSEFTNSNCVPQGITKNTYNIQNCTTIACTTIDCTTIDCTTVNCTTIQCTYVKCNAADSYESNCSNDS